MFLKRTTPAVLALLGLFAAAPLAAGPSDDPASVKHYQLFRVSNLPHLMESVQPNAEKLGLDDAQKAEVAAIRAEVPGKIMPLFERAEALELALSADILAGKTGDDLAARMDELQAVKRAAADVHVACIARVRALLRPGQYAQLLELAGHPGKDK